jgi:hypothetical protein
MEVVVRERVEKEIQSRMAITSTVPPEEVASLKAENAEHLRVPTLPHSVALFSCTSC